MRCGRMGLILALAHALASGAVPNDLQEIQKLAGCFEVSYRFVEDGSHDLFSERPGLSKPTKEWIGLEKTGENSFLLHHALFVGSEPPISHWREIWSQQSNTDTWTQEVWGGPPGLGSELRYRCTAPWSGNRWECHAGRAGKPLRDAGPPFGHDRSDYDWMDRRNVILVTPNGWVQNEHNRKMKSSGELVSHELGWITYTRIAEQQCEAASKQFPKNLP